MPINTNSKTRKQIRQSIGEMTGAMITGTVNGTGTSAQVIDSNGLTGGDDEYNGRFIAISDAGTADAEYRRVTDILLVVQLWRYKLLYLLHQLLQILMNFGMNVCHLNVLIL